MLTRAALQDIVKKAQQHVQDHKEYQQQYSRCLKEMQNAKTKLDRIARLSSGNRDDLAKKSAAVKDMLGQRAGLTNLANTCVQAGEALQSGSSPAVCDLAQSQIQQLQQMYDEIFDGLSALDRSLQSMAFLWNEYQDALKRMRTFLDYIANHSEMIRLEPSLEKKRASARQAHSR